MIPDYFGYEDNFKKYKDIRSNLIIEGKVKNPKITIAIPTYKRVELLKEALVSAINQKDFDDYNIIVVDNDDNNTDEVKNMILDINSEKVSYYKNEKNIGIFGNWNRCIELADGEYLSILNDDDWLEENFLFEITKYIDEKKIIYSQYKIHDKRILNNKKIKTSILREIYYQIRKIKKIRNLNIIDFFFTNRSAGTLGMIFERNTMLELGGYNEEYFPSADYFFHAKYCYYYGAKILKKELGNYRIQQNESMNPKTAILFQICNKNFRDFLIVKLHLKNYYAQLNLCLNEYNKKSINEVWKIDIIYDKKIFNKKYMYYFKLREIVKNIFG
ncbi:putative glycosyl transferase [Fusobacterium necrogenes]|uniref:Putative glycosyl transferase n=1 Tax=Fusobacterium necrogenes TaxID=858 RepID=A0A377GZ60_9FUSO|nr:glycosyltransferase family 2 protein [Fusobacterium necrogenes]STO32280.1 putative glycosyl transferase [Fusobacterium necrogenes]